MPLRPPLPVRLRRAGIVYPNWTIRAASLHKVPLDLLCAILTMETGGGHNVFGHDPTVAVGWGEVTEAKYKAYAVLREHTHLCQGVGPMQLTSKSLQLQADAAGGCWFPRANIAVGAHFIAQLIHEHPQGLLSAVRAYNGSGPAADAYATRALALKAHFHPVTV